MTQRYPSRLLIAGLFLGLAFDVLFTGKMLGLSVPLFALLLLAGLGLAVRWEGAQVFRANLWLPAALLFFAGMVLLRASVLLTSLNVCTALVLCGLLAFSLTQDSLARRSLPALLFAPLEALLLSMERGGRVTAHVVRHDLQGVPRPSRQRASSILKGLLLAVPVLLVFVPLLASADVIFAEMVERVLELEFLADLLDWASHGLVVLPIGLLAAGGLAYAVRSRQEPSPGSSGARLPRLLGFTEATVLMNTMNALFLLFVGVQLPYLFGGRLNITPSGFTYAEYARRGFGELVTVAVATLGLLLVLQAMTRRESPRQERAFNLSATLLLGLTCVMLASAFKRLLLYETAYGFTQLRLYVHVFMAWLGILLAWFALTLWRRPQRLALGVLIVALGFTGTLDLLNPDAFIVRQNMQRYQGTILPTSSTSLYARQIDVGYLTSLSEDAVPALFALAEQSPVATRRLIEEDLQQRLVTMEESTSWRRWQSFHVSRSRAYQLLLQRYKGGSHG